MSDTLYLQLIQISGTASAYLFSGHRKACLQQLKSPEPSPCSSCCQPGSHETGQYVMSVMDLIDMIQKKEPDLSISHIGEPDFILTYNKSSASGTVFQLVQNLFCLPCYFFRSRFFHHDL